MHSIDRIFKKLCRLLICYLFLHFSASTFGASGFEVPCVFHAEHGLRRGICRPFQECPRLMHMVNSYNKSVPRPKHITNYFHGARKSCDDYNDSTFKLFCCRGSRRYKCGDIKVNKIANGEDADPGEFPWMALLIHFDGLADQQKCGGTLIDEWNVLTAAHCITASSSNITHVVLGVHDTTQKNSYTHQRILVESYEIHPNFIREFSYNDIAIIHLKSRAMISNNNIQAICMPTQDMEKPKKGVITGWGAIEKGTASARILQRADIDIKYSDDYKSEFFVHSESNAGTCKGDSGGPVIAEVRTERRSRYYLFGVISIGPPGCNGKRESQVISVVAYLPWIIKNVKK